MSFPAFKIGLLFVKQVSKPIARYVKNQARTHPVLRQNVIRFAQAYHRVEVRMKRRQANLDGGITSATIRPLDDERAIDLAANFVSEGIIFTTAVIAVLLETYRKRMDDAGKQRMVVEGFEEMRSRLDAMQAELESIRKQVKEPPLPPVAPVLKDPKTSTELPASAAPVIPKPPEK